MKLTTALTSAALMGSCAYGDFIFPPDYVRREEKPRIYAVMEEAFVEPSVDYVLPEVSSRLESMTFETDSHGMSIPAPGPLALLGLSALVAYRRKR